MLPYFYTICRGIRAAINVWYCSAILHSVFGTPEQRTKTVNFDVCQNSQKSIGYHKQRPLRYCKIYVNFIIIIHIFTNAENLVKTGPVVAEIFGGICWFCHFISKGAFVTLVISGVTRPKFTMYWRYKVTYPYCDIPIPFKMLECQMNVNSLILLKIGCHGNVSWAIWKTGPDWQHSNKCLAFGKKCENRSSRSWDILLNLKKNNVSKVYSPVAKFANNSQFNLLHCTITEKNTDKKLKHKKEKKLRSTGSSQETAESVLRKEN